MRTIEQLSQIWQDFFDGKFLEIRPMDANKIMDDLYDTIPVLLEIAKLSDALLIAQKEANDATKSEDEFQLSFAHETLVRVALKNALAKLKEMG